MTLSKEELFQKHLEFEMNLIQEDKFQQTIAEELSFLYEEIENEKFSSLFPRDKFEKEILQIFENIELNEKSQKFIEENLEKIVEHLLKDSSSLSSFLEKKSFEEFLYILIGFKEIKNKLVHFVVQSPAYSRMISNVIYSSIKDFLITQNPLTRNNPLGTSILKLGQDLLNSLPGMEGNFDKKITEFIEKNLSGRLQDSETFILNELESDNIKEMVLEFWKFLETIKLSEITTELSSSNTKKILKTVPGFWKHLKDQKIFEKYTKEILDMIYTKFSEKKVSEIIFELGLSKESVINFVSESLNMTLNNDIFRNQYKKFISKRLKKFYDTL